MKRYLLILVLVIISFYPVYSQDRSVPLIPKVARPVYFDVSPPLRDMIKEFLNEDRSWKDGIVRNYIKDMNEINVPLSDPALQMQYGLLPGDTTIVNAEGMASGSAVPPDTYGEAGPNHYFQVVNLTYAIFNKAGQMIFGPIANSSVWSGMPNNVNSGDAVVLYDETADRWLFTQFSLPGNSNYQMIAISQTPDPMGPWYRYQYEFNYMPDYPKFGVWQDGYYMSSNNFGNGWEGNGAYGFDRTAMLAGDPDAVRISFEMGPGPDGFITLYPADCDGTLPLPGTPNYFGFVKTSTPQSFGIYEFHADFANPSLSTFGNKLNLPVTAFNPNLQGIPQLGSSAQLETLSDRLMYRLQYRRFNGYASMVVNHTVNAGSGVGGIRWYEFRKTTGPWSIYQQSTYSPDNHSRWMGSIAMDTAGSIALGYSISSATMHPAIRYTGRHKNDPLNQMSISEKTIIQGNGSQTGVWGGRSRWGDYSGMSVDPAAPTTFWFTTEYYPVTATGSWHTRIGSFTFDNVFSGFASAYPGKLCNGDSVYLEATVYGGTGNYTYQWSSIPPGFISTQKNPVTFIDTNTTFIVTISDGVSTILDSATTKVVYSPVPFSGNDTTVCEWLHTMDLHGTVTQNWFFSWHSAGDGIFGDKKELNTTYTFGPQDLACDSVQIYLFAGSLAPCFGTIHHHHTVWITPCTGLNNPVRDPAMSIRPNPAHDHALIVLEQLTGDAILIINTMDGKTMLKKNISKGVKIEENLDLSGFSKGIYQVRVITGTKILSDQLVVE